MSMWMEVFPSYAEFSAENVLPPVLFVELLHLIFCSCASGARL